VPISIRRLLGLAGLGLAAAAMAVAGLAVGVRLAGADEHQTALGGVQMSVEPSRDGHIDVFIPLADWGVRANAFSGPVKLNVEPRALDRPALVRVVAGNSALIEGTESDLRQAAKATFLRALLWGVVATAVGAILVGGLLAAGAHRSGRLVLGLPATAVLLALIAGVTTLWQLQRSFSLEAFERPTFYARGAEMQQLLSASEKAQRSGQLYGDQVARTLTSFASLLAASSEVATEPGRRALVASDLHANTLVLDALRRVSAEQPVLFAGDFGHDGNPGEIRLVARRVARLSTDVVAVSGNHDSRLLMRRLASHGVVVLTERGRLRADGRISGPPVVDFAGLRVAGFSDPLEWPGRRPDDPRRIFSFSELPDGDAASQAARDRLIHWFRSLPRRPDVVLVHQNGLAQALARELHGSGYSRPLTIVTGHDHRQHVDRHGSVIVVDGGTAGAGGVLAAGSDAIGVAEVHFGGSPPALRAVDLIRVEPFSGAAEARREVIEPPLGGALAPIQARP
jgi:predicted phosphodiesterase